MDVPWAGDRGDMSHECPCPLWLWWHFPTHACLAPHGDVWGDMLSGTGHPSHSLTLLLLETPILAPTPV